MSDILNNMSAPPKSLVCFKKLQLNKYIAFNPLTLCKLLNENNYNDTLDKSVKKYVDNNINILRNIKKPTGYMIGEYIDLSNDLDSKQLERKLSYYNYEECLDLELLILVLCSTVGDLYIPNRELSYEKGKFNKVLLFSKEEVDI